MAKATALIAAGLALLLTACGSSEFDHYTQRCHEKGGIVSRAYNEEKGRASSKYTCIGDSSAPLLPVYSF